MYVSGTCSSTKVALSPGRSVNSHATPVPVNSSGWRGLEREAQARRREDGALLVEHRLVLVARVVEARLDLEQEAHLAANAEDPPDQPVPVSRLAARGSA